MAKEGYVVYVVTARERGKPKGEPRRLDDLNGQGADLIDLVRAEERRFWDDAVPEKRARYEFAYTFNRGTRPWPGSGRLMIHAEAGPYGRRGRMVQVDTGTGSPFHQREAAMIPLRAGLMTFHGERYGLLFCERRSGLTIKHDYEAAILKPAAKRAGVVVELQQHVDIPTWEEFLEDAQVASVKAVYFSTRREDYLPTEGKDAKLAMTVEGPPAQRAGTGLIRQMLESVKGGGSRPDAVLTADLRPQGEGFRRDKVILKATAHEVTRTVVFEQSGFPQWVYELEEHPSTGTLMEMWEDHGPKLIRRYLSDPLDYTEPDQ